MPSRPNKGKPPTRYESMPPPPPPPKASKASAPKNKQKSSLVPPSEPNRVRKRRSDTNVSELDRRDHEESGGRGRRGPQEIAQQTLTLLQPSKPGDNDSGDTPGSRLHLRGPSESPGPRLRLKSPRRASVEAVAPPPPKSTQTQELDEPESQIPSDSQKGHKWKLGNLTNSRLLIPDEFQQDSWWQGLTQRETEPPPPNREAAGARDIIDVLDDDSDDGLHTQYPNIDLIPDRTERSVTKDPSPQTSLPPQAGSRLPPSQKTSVPLPRPIQKKPETAEDNRDDEEITFTSRLFWGHAQKPTWENSETDKKGGFDIDGLFKEMDIRINAKVNPQGLNAFLVSSTATPIHSKLQKNRHRTIQLERQWLHSK